LALANLFPQKIDGNFTPEVIVDALLDSLVVEATMLSGDTLFSGSRRDLDQITAKRCMGNSNVSSVENSCFNSSSSDGKGLMPRIVTASKLDGRISASSD
jgi:hypothetical protein